MSLLVIEEHVSAERVQNGRLRLGTRGVAPITIVHEGEWLPDEMRRLRMQRADVRTAMRQQGMIEEVDQRYIIVERDGTISLIPAK